MAEYTGVMAVTMTSDRMRGIFPYADRRGLIYSPVEFTTEKSHGGSCSMLLKGGHKYSINVGCDAGSRTITFWAYPENASAKVRGELYHPDTMALVASAVNSGGGSWQQMTINFTAEKKVYILRLVNYSDRANTAKRVWIDDLEVS